ncbi:MAG TPA: hypothetical protein VFO85_12325, partial [Vicinamibacteria bacterium]|nr:hypothetical protein [Vicinamibacteria bacterium]
MPEDPGLGGRVRGALRRFLASLSGGPPAAREDPAPEAAPAPLEEAAPAPSWDERLQALERARRMVTIPLFAELSEEELLGAVQGLQLQAFPPGHILVTEGQEGQSLFVITA